ncbi:hypothetical protein [Enterobacter asburiae]
MRHFTSSQVDQFLNAFGESIQFNGAAFTAIVDVRPVVIDSGTEGLVESDETFISMKTTKWKELGFVIGDELTIDSTGIVYTIYNIHDDLSGVVEVYIRPTVNNNFGSYYYGTP